MAKKKKNRRAVLVTSCLMAALIVGSSTFAWFSSKDEVTNRLTASSNYGVTIAEDFTPPENWVPGQTVDKNVGVVNTGNVDAFVRAWLEGEMRLLNKTTSAIAYTGMSSASLTNVEDDQMTKANLNFSTGTGENLVYLKELDNTKMIINPDTQEAGTPPAYTEVMAVQSGGELAYVAPGSSYKFKANEAMSVTNNKGEIQHIQKDVEYTVTVAADDNSATVGDIVVSGTGITLQNLNAFRKIDSNSFKPVSDGLYVFRRNVDLDSSDTYEFTGYYVKTIDAVQHYFALEDNSQITAVTAGDKSYTVNVSNVKMFAAKQETIENSGLTWTYDDSSKKLTVKKTGDTGKLSIDVQLVAANIDSGSEKWTVANTGSAKYTFYYNNDLEEGASTSQLVDSVTLSSEATNTDYIAFDFDLNVKMESVQVTVDENGNEGFDTVASGAWATSNTNVTVKSGSGTVENGEITKITWNNA